MNLQEADILRTIREEGFVSQRRLSELSGHSLGAVNKSLKNLTEAGLLDAELRPTEAAEKLFRACAPRAAVILAAESAMRTVPINSLTPSALLTLRGERLIERLIRQLWSAGIMDITVVAGFMKESFEYLIDEYGVQLVVNEEGESAGSLRSLALAAERLRNCYIVPGELWCEKSPFRRDELYSWYAVSRAEEESSTLRLSRKLELVTTDRGEGSRLLGVAYLAGAEAEAVRQKLAAPKRTLPGAAWEETLREGDRLIVRARVLDDGTDVRLRSYEQLRELETGADRLRPEAIAAIAHALGCKESEIRDCRVLRKDLTSRSFVFDAGAERYVMRVPNEGAEKLVNRRQEAAAYRAIAGSGLCIEPLLLETENGWRLTRLGEGERACDPNDVEDLRRCVALLRELHGLRLSVPHSFNLFWQIRYYERLRGDEPSAFRDYEKTRENILSLEEYIDRLEKGRSLCCVAAAPESFRFISDGDGGERVQLADWEFAGMQDPHADVAMFCARGLFDRERCDAVIDLYFEGGCDERTRTKIYCYIALCALLLSNFCELRRTLGVESGAFGLREYRCAKEFYRLARNRMERERK